MIARRLAAGLALAAVVLLTIAEFTTVFEVTVGSLEVVKRSATGGENHGYALLVIAVAAAPLALLALRGDPLPAIALVALGVAALGLTLALDLPDTRGSGGLPESVAYENARAHAGPGFWLQLEGGALLVLAGAILLVTTGMPRPSRAGRARDA